MPEPYSLASLGQLVAHKRGKVGIRTTAREIGVSPATLSRIENGKLPDLENFAKICQWLEVDPASVLGFDPEDRGRRTVAVHFRSEKTMAVETAAALQELILAAQHTLAEEEGND